MPASRRSFRLFKGHRQGAQWGIPAGMGCRPLPVTLAIVVCLLLMGPAGRLVLAAETLDLSPRGPLQPATVTVDWQLAGDLRLPPSLTKLPANNSAPPQVRATAQVAFDHHPLAEGDTQGAGHVRFYHQVEAKVAVDTNLRERSLRADRRLMIARPSDKGVQLLAVEGPLTREELDSTQLPFDVLFLSRLLPSEPVEIGATWSHGADVVGPLTLLENLEVAEAQSVLVEANSQFAKCQVVGTAHGTIEGTRTALEFDGVYLVDIQRGEVTQMNVALRESREIGPVTPGLAGVIKLRIKVTPQPSTHLTPELVTRARNSYPIPARAIETVSPELGFRVTHDTSWFSTGTRGRAMTLRKIEGSTLVAHATLTRLPPKQLVPEQSLAEFRSDVANTIGKPLAGIASDEQFVNQHGCRVMHVVAQGEVEGVAVEWHAYQVAPPEDRPGGDRLALTFVIEASQLETLRDDDRQLVERIELVERTREIAAEKNSGVR